MDKEIIAEIRNKLQTSLTTIERLDGGENVSKDFINKALRELQEAAELLKGCCSK